MARILAVDAGTTGVTAMVVDETGAVLGKGYAEFPQAFPRPGRVEHDPEHWWVAMLSAVPDACASARTEVSALTAIGIANQRETTVVWDRSTLRPVHPAIVWQDRRTTALCDRLRDEGWQDRVRGRTGLVIDPYFSATKLAWILDHVDGAREAASTGRLAFGTVDSYLLARLTAGAVHLTDRTNAARTMLFDIHQTAWDAEIMDRLRIPPRVMPGIVPSWGDIATTEPDAFFGIRVPIAGIAGDQQSALFGQACFEPGATKNTYGTGSFVLMHTGPTAPVSSSGLITTLACSAEGTLSYALEGSIFVTGAAIQWLRDGLGIIERASDVGPLAASVADSGDVFFVPALTGLGAPWWDPHARGTIVGLTRGTKKAHIARAAVEAIAFQTRDVVDAMRDDAGLSLTELKADGGASAMDLLLQLQADLLRVPVRRPMTQETTALGAAYLAGLGTGVWSSTQELARHWRCEAEFVPREPESADRGYRRWRSAVTRALGWAAPQPDDAGDGLPVVPQG